MRAPMSWLRLSRCLRMDRVIFCRGAMLINEPFQNERAKAAEVTRGALSWPFRAARRSFGECLARMLSGAEMAFSRENAQILCLQEVIIPLTFARLRVFRKS